jgi:hypothetical protein
LYGAIRTPYGPGRMTSAAVACVTWREGMRSHVYAVDVRPVGGELLLYFNARSAWHWLVGREAIGRATAELA